jgi:guanylate kinase
MEQGNLYVISAPSGAGKTTVLHALLRQLPGLKVSVSCTTRAPRPGETDGVDYHFVTRARFDAMVAAAEFLEWAEVHAHAYGTPKIPIAQWRGDGQDVVLDIDIQGAAQVKTALPDATLIFLAPPSLTELEQRLRGRGTESPASLARRLEKAEAEMAAQDAYDHVVVNHDIAQATQCIVTIIDNARVQA